MKLNQQVVNNIFGLKNAADNGTFQYDDFTFDFFEGTILFNSSLREDWESIVVSTEKENGKYKVHVHYRGYDYLYDELEATVDSLSNYLIKYLVSIHNSDDE